MTFDSSKLSEGGSEQLVASTLCTQFEDLPPKPGAGGVARRQTVRVGVGSVPEGGFSLLIPLKKKKRDRERESDIYIYIIEG